MNLQEKLRRADEILESDGSLERRAEMKKIVAALNKAVDGFLDSAEVELLRNDPDYSELSALLTSPLYKSTITAKWLRERADGAGLKIAKGTKKEKESFALEMVRLSRAGDIIRELKETPRRRMRDLFSELAELLPDEKEVEQRVKALKKDFRDFCQYNDVPVVNNAKGSPDVRKTLPRVIELLKKRRASFDLAR
jgi:hypothetical protein